MNVVNVSSAVHFAKKQIMAPDGPGTRRLFEDGPGTRRSREDGPGTRRSREDGPGTRKSFR